MATTIPRLELRGITKRFGALVANDQIDLTVMPGEVHVLLGENGAGKSTLMNTLFGLYTPDSGQIVVNGQVQQFASPRDAIAVGIGMVHQHFMLIPVFTVAENMMLGREWTSGPLGHLSLSEARRRIRELSDSYGLSVDPDAVVGDLPVGMQQRVEILKALMGGAEVLILDEPTAVLTPQEIDELIRVMRQLREAGTAVLFISHKLREIKAVADRITVLRRGRIVGQASPGDSEQHLASLMVGREVSLLVDRPTADPKDPVLTVSGLEIDSTLGTPAVAGVDLTVRAGEIVALAGVQGNGQEELVEALLGLRPVRAGSIEVSGSPPLVLRGAADDPTTDDLLRAGVGYVPEDRQHDGLVGSFSVAENLVLDLHDQSPYSGRFLIRPAEVEANAAARIDEFDIRTGSASAAVTTLSGGNQQKVVLAREMSRPLRLLVVSQPTRGVDVGAQEFIHRRLVAERDRGSAVLLVSTELDEILALADRTVVLYRGRVIGECPSGATRDEVGLMMAGGYRAQPRAEASARATHLSGADGASAPTGASPRDPLQESSRS
ncbi:ABC transporter ATP-binding protein (plasmid) [Streptomyces sp. AHU1]|uniref:ABC transporter ATP-binding protein n=1 Tax=Streptomyces sp. AHU1 TaxID=3377215 RepID=UPI003877CD00